ncbi:MAG: hypothetical protein VYD92_11830 [Pseudomonadota bacterium]|nr:hypothetical protein [Pseudomonadota bacterium]
MQLQSTSYDLTDSADIQEFFHSRGWTDGFPIVPPTPELVQNCLEWVGMSADQLIGVEPVKERAIVVEKLAINAIMAGCLPVHFPIVVAAWNAMLQPQFLLHGATASTGGCAVLSILNGPIRLEIEAKAEFDVLGNGARATSVIGRALRLGLINILNVSPGAIDRSTLGHPGKISYCLAEDEEGTNWQSLAQSRGIPEQVSAITVVASGAPRQIMNEWTSVPEEILDTYVAEIRANMLNYSIWAGDYVIVIPKQHRDYLEAAGWSKADVAQYIYENARVKRSEWGQVGKQAVVRDKGDVTYNALMEPKNLLVLAAGGPAGGFGAIIPPWLGTKSRAVTVAIGACVNCES